MVIKNSSNYQEKRTNSFRKFYFFEVLNADDLSSGVSQKASLRERGPYVYENKEEKRYLKFSDDGKNLSFTPVFSLFFRRDLSIGPESDSFMFLNLPLVGAVDQIETGQFDINPFFLSILNVQLNTNTNVFINRTVYDLLNGYTDFLTQTIEQFQPGSLKDSKFSLLSGRNGTEYQNLTILTGKDDITQVGKILTWNNLIKLPFWDSDLANQIQGSDGSLFGPFKTKKDTLYVFNSDVCRSVKLNFVRESQVYGIKVLDFSPANDVLHNSTENAGFFKENYIGDGVFSLKKCSGFPIFISSPHFLNADNKFINSIDGVTKPNANLHDTTLKIYPLLGTSIAVKTRVQLNFKLQKSNKIDLFNNVTDVLLPTVWFEDDITLTNDSKEKLTRLDIISRLIDIFPLVLLIVGIFLILIAITLACIYICFRCR